MKPAIANGAGGGLIRVADSEALSSEHQIVELEPELHVDADVSVGDATKQVFLVFNPEQGFGGGEELSMVTEAVFNI